MFLMGLNATPLSGNERDSEATSAPGHSNGRDRSAAFVSPRRNRPATTSGLGHVERPDSLASPRHMRQHFSGSSGNLFEDDRAAEQAGEKQGKYFPRSGSMPPASPPKDAGIFDYYSLQADPSQSNALRDSPSLASFPIPVVPDRDEIADIEKRVQGDTGIADGQLLPEEAELLRREVDTQRRMLQDHDSKLREQHGELVELTEQKRCLEVQMESTIQHVVKVMSEDKKRLNERIVGLEHDKAQVVHSNQQLQGLVNAMGRDLQGKMHEIGSLHGRIHRDGDLAKKAIKVVPNYVSRNPEPRDTCYLTIATIMFPVTGLLVELTQCCCLWVHRFSVIFL